MNVPPNILTIGGLGLVLTLLGGAAFAQAQQAISAGASPDDAGWLTMGTHTTRTERLQRQGTAVTYAQQKSFGGTGVGFGLLLIGGAIAAGYLGDEDEV